MLKPISIYSVTREDEDKSFGQLYLSAVDQFDPLPDFEMVDVQAFEKIPNNLTYPLVYPTLIQTVMEFENQ
ncbi:hypothetical protein FHR92_005136 [Fontibacillus solani]|uniref:Uncharacterized protein n=1 Tax=Fontibacillus solani TaxID=1572857 RepID=A0A7W3SYT0_9BACL|nr:hypothetical protein [Fontibacillus solani]MBA9088618.1 hypothetical protein [Fontibacillus solani]